jgi:hypothetical protein
VKAATLDVGEKGLDMRALLVQLHGRIQVSHIGDEIDRRLIPLLSNRDVAWKAIHRIDERSKPLVQRGNIEHFQPRQQ